MDSRKGMTPLAAGMTGIVIGAVGTAVGIAMSNKDNRKKVKTKASDLANWGNKQMKAVKESSSQFLEKSSKADDELTKSEPRQGAKGGKSSNRTNSSK